MTFMRPNDIEIETVLTTCESPVSRAAEVRVTGDYNHVAVEFDLPNITGYEDVAPSAGVFLCIDDMDGSLKIEIYSDENDVASFKLVGREWKQQPVGEPNEPN